MSGFDNYIKEIEKDASLKAATNGMGRGQVKSIKMCKACVLDESWCDSCHNVIRGEKE